MTSTAFYHVHAIRNRLSFAALLFAAIGVGVLSRSTWIQLIGDPQLERLSKRQFSSTVSAQARRGLIVDRSGEPLAINLEATSVAIHPSKILKSPTSLVHLARALGKSVQETRKLLKPKKSFLWLERRLSEERLLFLQTRGLFALPPDEVWIVKEMRRIYPHGTLAAPLIGSINLDNRGIEGVEYWKDEMLRGQGTSVIAIRDALGRPAMIQGARESRTLDGTNIELSIDASLQFAVEDALSDSVNKTASDSGLAMVMNANTGEILALAQAPSFNPNHRSGGGSSRKLKALTDGYEPGSTMKPLAVAIGLNHGMKTSDSLFGHHGSFSVQGKPIREAEAHERFGYISLKKMLEVSSNIVAAELALKIGSDRFLKGLKLLGITEKTGTQFPGEIAGWIPGVKTENTKLKPLSLANLGFGQGVMVTPIQMLRAYGALSNGGNLVAPRLLKLPEGEKPSSQPIFESKIAKAVSDALLAVTEGENGTGKLARVEGYKIAGKTGTAQTVDPRSKRYSKSRYIASFIGYPIGTQQNFVVLTLLDHPKGTYFASKTAAPLFSAVMKSVLSRYSVPATEPQKEATPAPFLAEAERSPASLPESEIATPSSSVTQTFAASELVAMIEQEKMPPLVGLTPQEAIRNLRPFGAKISVHGFGLIKRQIPESGTPLNSTSRVSLYLGE